MVRLKHQFSCAATGLVALSVGSLLANHYYWTGSALWWSVERSLVGPSPRRTEPTPLYDIHGDILPESLPPSLTHRPFPRWGDTLPDEQTNGLDMAPLLDFILNSSAHAHVPNRNSSSSSLYQRTTDHAHDVNYWLPETLYVLDVDGLWTSRLHRTMTGYGKGTVKDKLVPVERQAVNAWNILQNNNNNNKWPRLRQLLVRYNHTDPQQPQPQQATGFPYLAWYGDYTGCNHRNWQNGRYSIPLFTNAARVDCPYAVPFPNYQTIRDANKDSPQQWQEIMQHDYATQYPWSDKRAQIVWRGSLTGYIHNATTKNPRWRMVQTIHQLEQEYYSRQQQKNNNTIPFLFDVRATRLPRRHDIWNLNTSEVGGILSEKTPMTDFQKYRGILDHDGNSWSSRFGALLCYNSVILKVEPTWVEYFHNPPPQQRQQSSTLLQPWTHYIPVAADLSDLVERANFVINPANDKVLQTIVHNANAWCQEHLIRDRVARDMLDIWERYVEWLDIGTPHWQSTVWKNVKTQIFAPDSPLDMVRLSSSASMVDRDDDDVNTL